MRILSTLMAKLVAQLAVVAITLLPATVAHGVVSAAARASADVQIRRIKSSMVSGAGGDVAPDQAMGSLKKFQIDLRGEKV